MKRFLIIIALILTVAGIGFAGSFLYAFNQHEAKVKINDRIVSDIKEIVAFTDEADEYFIDIIDGIYTNEIMVFGFTVIHVGKAGSHLRNMTKDAQSGLDMIDDSHDAALKVYVMRSEMLLAAYNIHADSYDKVYDLIKNSSGARALVNQNALGTLRATSRKIVGLKNALIAARSAYFQ